MNKVSIFIVGFMKSGTTALAQFLSEHPEVCISVPKEPAFFATDLMRESDNFHRKKAYFKTRSLNEYANLFKHAKKNEKVLGEASTAYIYSRVAAQNIFEHNPEAKIIIMLRNPADFLYSLHMQYLNETTENEPDFKTALSLEKNRSEKNKKIPSRVRVPSYLYYSKRANYFEQIKRFYNIFPKENIKVIVNEQFQKENLTTYREVLKFIGVDTTFKPGFKVVHGAKTPRSTLIHKMLHNITLKNFLYKLLGGHFYTRTHKFISKLLMQQKLRKPLDPVLRDELMNKYKKNIKKTSDLVNIDLVKIWYKE